MNFFGKYRGTVANNVDPMMMGRVQVTCPTVLGSGSLSWAMPCVPYAGSGVGWFAIPPVGASIWVEFEGGDPDYPIWTGCFWALPTDVPASPAIAEQKVLKTDCMNLVMSDLPGAGGITLELSAPAVSVPISLTMDSNGVTLTLDPSEITVKVDGITLENGAASITIEAAAINASVSPSELKIEPAGIEASCSPATVKIAPASIDLENGAGLVAVGPAGVSANNGALDVI
jgi:hypothetical protein